ncbi:MAG: glutamine amidotransferase, partial [Bacteroidota bacterium]
MNKLYWLLLPCFWLLACESPGEPKDLGSEEQLHINKRSPVIAPNRYNVAFLIMDGVYNTELTAPYDIFQHTIFRDSIKAMNVFLVADTHQAITSFEGIRLLPDYNYLSDELPP